MRLWWNLRWISVDTSFTLTVISKILYGSSSNICVLCNPDIPFPISMWDYICHTVSIFYCKGSSSFSCSIHMTPAVNKAKAVLFLFPCSSFVLLKTRHKVGRFTWIFLSFLLCYLLLTNLWHDINWGSERLQSKTKQQFLIFLVVQRWDG